MEISGKTSETERTDLCEHIRINIEETGDHCPEYYESLEIYCVVCNVMHEVEVFVN